MDRQVTEKLRVVILFGGRSGEHDVSLASATSVLNALDVNRFAPLPVYLDQHGNWFPGTSPSDAARGDTVSSDSTIAACDLLNDPFRWLQNQADVVFPVLHGTYGEDGTMQGLLEILGLPYVGPGVAASAVAMDKAIFKQLMEAHGLPVLPWQLVTAKQLDAEVDQVIDQLEAKLAYPLFTKPANLGSSVRISRCEDRSDLLAGLKEARRYDLRVVVEQGIRPRELEIAILGNDDPQASVVGEIRPQRSFYDYTAKYLSGDSELLIPAPLDARTARDSQELAIAAFRAIDGVGMGRVDLFLDATDERLYVNEINTIPGFTEISMFPKLWEASGIGYRELVTQLIDLGLERARQTQTLTRTYRALVAE
ncbi:MAG TPA: D-alanine--D-alanine ligase family protein [Pirellulaceae bacterium]|nr:D-alanine--D-alanine ligase family protein [Pirellulaceae bacterium]